MEWKKAIVNLKKFKAEIPKLVANEMVNFALDNLSNEVDVNGVPLKPRKANAVRNSGRRILLDTGDGDRSVRISEMNSDHVDLTANEYMEAHNTGAHIKKTVNVRRHTRKRKGRTEDVDSHSRAMDITLPKRTFIAPSDKLDERIVNTLESRFKKLTS